MTPVDALDTMIIVGMKDEAARTRAYIIDNLSFDKDISVQNSKSQFVCLVVCLATTNSVGTNACCSWRKTWEQIVAGLDSPTGMPYRFVNLKTGKVLGPCKQSGRDLVLLLIEFGTLSKLTNRAFSTTKRNALWWRHTKGVHRSSRRRRIDVETESGPIRTATSAAA